MSEETLRVGGRSEEAPREEASTNNFESTGEPRLDAALRNIKALSEKGAGIICIGGIAGATLFDANNRNEIRSAILDHFPNVSFADPSTEGYSSAALERLKEKHGGKLVVVDSPIASAPLEQLPFNKALRGDSARDVLKASVANSDEDAVVLDHAKEAFEELYREALALGNMHVALPTSPAGLALIAYAYAKKSEREWNETTLASILTDLPSADDAAYELHFTGQDFSVLLGTESLAL